MPGVVALMLMPGAMEITQNTGVLLQVRPGTGDTIRVRLDQTVEMTGPPGAENERKSAVRNAGA